MEKGRRAAPFCKETKRFEGEASMANGDGTVRVDQRLKHIAFIMDGNGRWARAKGKPREYGHKFGADVFRRVARYCAEIGIKHVTVYAFSTENWKRPEIEVKTIMKLFSDYLEEAKAHFAEYDLRVIFLGDKNVFQPALREKMEQIEKDTAGGQVILNIAFNYGARDELLRAMELLRHKEGRITEEDVSGALYTAHSPDPDLIVRTGGEHRLSNFLLWQAAYAEIYVTDVLWPDFNEAEVSRAVEWFYSRKRRYGGV